MHDGYPSEAPNYTNAFLVSAYMLLFMSLWMIAVAVGYFWVWPTAVVLHGAIRLIRRA